MRKKKLIIVDISSFIFRAFYAIRMLNAPDGRPVNAVSGVFSMLLKLLSKQRPTHVLLARDTRGGSFRNEMYSEYKANRSAPPEELVPQFEIIENLILKMKLPNCQIENFEADDIIGAAAVQWKDQFDEIYIASSDKDLMQFIEGNVKMLDTQKDVLYGRQEVFEKMGVWPEQIVDYLSMLGDASDNIPGMKGIGAKGAAKLLAEHGTLDKCIEVKDTFSGKKLTNAFENHLDDAYLSRDLIKIKTDFDLGLTADESEFKFAPDDELVAFLQDLGFKGAVKRMQDVAREESFAQNRESEEQFVAPAAQSVDASMKLVGDDLSFEEFLAIIKAAPKLSLYNYFDSSNIVTRKATVFFVSVDGNENYCLPFSMGDSFDGNNLPEEQLAEFLKSTLGRADLECVVTYSKDLMKLSQSHNIECSARLYDIVQAHFVAYPDTKHELDFILENVVGIVPLPITKGLEAQSMLREDLKNFGAVRCQGIFLAYDKLEEQLNAREVTKVLNDIDLPLLPVLSKMEENGIILNPPFLKTLEKELSEQLAVIEKTVDAEAEAAGSENRPVNLKSPKQVGVLLFEDMQLPVIKKTKTGYSTNSEVLEELMVRTDSEVPGLILKYREMDKLLSTYVKALPELVNSNSKRIHSNFNAHVAATGRLSSTNPNLQNIPVRSELGKRVRKAFIATPGKLLLSADYSQVELRLLAHFSEDPTMVQAFKNNEDIHAQTASEIMGIPLDKVCSEERSKAKAVNFGLMYGQSSFGLAKAVGISRTEAKEYITSYFERFSRVKQFLDGLRQDCEANGYVETMFGRRRYLPNIHSSNRMIKAVAEREAINSPIQGTGADIIKLAMINLDKKITEMKLESKMLLQVHDELIFEVPESELELMKKLVREEMENVVELSVPLKVDMGVGVNWYDLK